MNNCKNVNNILHFVFGILEMIKDIIIIKNKFYNGA